MTPVDPAGGKGAPPGSPDWYALLFTPEERRPAVAALVELRAEIMGSARGPSEPAVARARLDWWRAELAAFGQGRAQHPVLRRLRDTSPGGAVQPEYLLELVDAFDSELGPGPCRNYAELSLYCYRSGGVLQEMIAGVLGLADTANERAVRRYAQRLGTGARLVELIANLRADLAAGRRLLPRDWIEETGAREEFVATPMNPALAACVDRLAGEARVALDEAEGLLPGIERPRQRTGLVLAALYRRHLDRLHRAGFDPEAAPGNLDNLWTCWRAARRSRRTGP
ncbi:squalene/phytoene synthase family protein [Thioalkalivibrio sp. XN8]|uniref:squalene/phytoene synthase family protein n=1 Tax=Thioalkalivibrio sp. XN8 TaxID=2712863 RepID=UPI0013E9E1E8|nr:squalene/phytoene synthase family protein [Thioalkalivibrio sp. XN8]